MDLKVLQTIGLGSEIQQVAESNPFGETMKFVLLKLPYVCAYSNWPPYSEDF